MRYHVVRWDKVVHTFVTADITFDRHGNVDGRGIIVMLTCHRTIKLGDNSKNKITDQAITCLTCLVKGDP